TRVTLQTALMRSSPEMSRWHSREESPDTRTPSATPTTQIDGRRLDQGQEQARGGSADGNNRRADERNVPSDARESRRPYRDRGRTYMLRTSEIQALTDITKLPAIAPKTLGHYRFSGKPSQTEE